MALGIELSTNMIGKRLDAAAAMTGHKMSMLQNLDEAGHWSYPRSSKPFRRLGG